MKLRIREISTDGHNGHITAHLHIEHDHDGQVVQGALETFGIDPIALDRRFNGSVGQWLAWVGRQMKDKHQRRTAVHADLSGLKGKTIDVGE
jgi:hypothetical protein